MSNSVQSYEADTRYKELLKLSPIFKSLDLGPGQVSLLTKVLGTWPRLILRILKSRLCFVNWWDWVSFISIIVSDMSNSVQSYKADTRYKELSKLSLSFKGLDLSPGQVSLLTKVLGTWPRLILSILKSRLCFENWWDWVSVISIRISDMSNSLLSYKNFSGKTKVTLMRKTYSTC